MPTYYSCGELFADTPDDDTVYLSYSCGCGDDEEEDEEGYPDDHVDDRVSSVVASMIAHLRDTDVPDMQVPSVLREVSCEWEASEGVATAHQACDMIRLMAGGADCDYHGDGTCDGEVVFGRLRLWEPMSALRYGRSVRAIEELRRDGAIRVGFDSGHHIHVAVRNQIGRGLSPNGIVSLYSVFAHCEDLLYRLASAGWSMHRSEAIGGNYSDPMKKLDHGQTRSAREVCFRIGDTRYQGLNITPYLDQIVRCRCGAYRFGEWESCECHDQGMTVEWRLWNASVSPRKIRAYIAISAVLTDYAANVDVRDVNFLTENPFQGTGTVDEDSLLTQLDYLTTRPGFTARDRKDIYWLASIAPGMGSIGREYEASRGTVLGNHYDASPVVS